MAGSIVDGIGAAVGAFRTRSSVRQQAHGAAHITAQPVDDAEGFTARPADDSAPDAAEPQDPQFWPLIPESLTPAFAKGSRARRLADRWERAEFDREVPSSRRHHPEVRRRRVDGLLRLVRTSTVRSEDEAIGYNRDLVVDLCEAYGIDYFVVPEPNAPRQRIGIEERDWVAFCQAVAETAAEHPLYLTVTGQRRSGESEKWAGLADQADIQRALRSQPRTEVFRFLPLEGGTVVGVTRACLVEKWVEDADGALRAPIWNRRAEYVSGDYRERIRHVVAGRDVATLRAFRYDDLLDVTMPIDAVYVWVDDSDPVWAQRKDEALRRLGREALAGAADFRFANHDELRYSLRSVDQYAPWFRKIFLVTDGQRPSWLRADQQRITVVDHRDIFPADAPPVFNSEAIESRVHHIEGLAEHYVLFNDDFFIGRRVQPQTFFDSNGTGKFMLSRRKTLDCFGLGEGAPHELSRRNTVSLIERDFGVTASRLFAHAPMAYRKSLVLELEERYRDEFELVCRLPFRDSRSFQTTWLHHYYGYLTGRMRPVTLQYKYFEPIPDVWVLLNALIRERNLDFFCINDVTSPEPKMFDKITNWLARYYPTPGAYES